MHNESKVRNSKWSRICCNVAIGTLLLPAYNILNRFKKLIFHSYIYKPSQILFLVCPPLNFMTLLLLQDCLNFSCLSLYCKKLVDIPFFFLIVDNEKLIVIHHDMDFASVWPFFFLYSRRNKTYSNVIAAKLESPVIITN
jgi:hypothetical protein